MGFVPARARALERRPEHLAADRAATCLPRLAIAPDAATVGTLLRSADSGARERLVGTLQRLHGNTAVQRLLEPAGAPALPVQRWRVGLARGTTDCERIVGYVNAHSPYAATSGWAQTKARFRWHGNPAYTDDGGTLTATVANPRVTPTVTVDMPTWAPTDPGIRDAWSATMADLRAHEARHEAIAEEWEATLLDRLTNLTVDVANRRRRTWTAAVQAEWNGWIADHQDAQLAIDPYEAVFTCPTPLPAAATETAAE
jgi:predicted secreted Zn-dependent protease